jgi:hypothetical protein
MIAAMGTIEAAASTPASPGERMGYELIDGMRVTGYTRKQS